MADTPIPITSLPAAGSLTGSEDVPIDQSGTTVRTTTAAIAGLAAGGVTGVGLSGTPRTGTIVLAPGSGVTITESPNGTFTFAGSGGASAYDAAILATSGLTHYWPCNDVLGSAAAVDAKGSTNLTANGNVSFGSRALARDGETSCFFPNQGATDFLLFPNGLIPGSGSFSFEFIGSFSWVPSGVISSQPYFFSSDNVTDFALLVSTLGYLQICTTGAGFATCTLAPPPCERVHYAITFNASGNVLTVYANAVQVYQQNSATAPSQSGDGKIGVDAQSGATSEQALGGNMSKIALYTVALTHAQVLAHYALI